jgi:hypothetical protein
MGPGTPPQASLSPAAGWLWPGPGEPLFAQASWALPERPRVSAPQYNSNLACILEACLSTNAGVPPLAGVGARLPDASPAV